MLQFDNSSNGSTVQLQVEQDFEITLAEIATTGYRWVLESNGEPACVLLDDSFDPPPVNPPDLPGSHHWHFQAVEPGNVDISLAYRRAWEKTKSSTQTFTLHMQVLPAQASQDSTE